jgi:HK97 gp10 family phage protein
VKIIGQSRLRARLIALGVEAEAAATPAARAAANVVTARARSFAPKRTGKMAQGIRTEEVEHGKAATVATVAWTKFQEFGTVHVRAQHFLRQASQAHRKIAGAMVPVFRGAIR